MSSITDRILNLTGDYIREIKDLTSQVVIAVGRLEEIRKEYETSWWKRGVEVLKLVLPLIGVGLMIWGLQYIPCGTNLEFGGIKIVRACVCKT